MDVLKEYSHSQTEYFEKITIKLNNFKEPLDKQT